MDRIISFMEDLRTRFTDWWTARIETAGCTFGKEHMLRKDRVLDWIFLKNPLGRFVYRRMSGNDWTWVRLYWSPIPMIYLVSGHTLAACVFQVLIEITDMLDGWFARSQGFVSAWGERFETRVDWVFRMELCVGVFIRFPDVRPLMTVVGALEVVRAVGGDYLYRVGFAPHPNDSGKWKTPFYAGGIGFKLIHDLVINAPSVHRLFALLVLYCVYACMVTGIILSIVSLGKHLCDYHVWKQARQRR